MSALPLFAEPVSTARPLRPHQSKGLALLKRSLLAGNRRVVVQMPTGAGKTRFAAEIVNGALAKGNRVAFTVPAISLIDQTVESFTMEGIDCIGVMQASHELTHYGMPVQVCSVQTLARRGYPEADVIVVDECHMRFKAISEWMKLEPGKTFIGLSATPWARGMTEDWQALVTPVTVHELIEQGFLSPFRVYAPSHPDLSGVRTVAGDYHEGDLGAVMGESFLVADIVQTWLQRAEGRPTLVFAVDRAHAAKLQSEFNRAGVPMGYCDAHTDRIERKVLFDRMARGELAGICNVGTLTTGVDADVRCIVLARPTKSEMLHVQIIGRGLRTAPGKADCLASGTKILTQRGLVPIEKVSISDKLWDGQQWVRHEGVISKGKQRVITYQGLTGTPDHKVWTAEGWRTLGECECQKIAIVQTGFGGQEIRISPRHLPGFRVARKTRLSAGVCADALRWVWGGTVHLARQFRAWADQGVQGLQSARAVPAMALSSFAGSAATLHEPERRSVSGLWGAWDNLRLRQSCRRGALGAGEPWIAGESEAGGDRSDRQRQGLCRGEPSLGFASAQQTQPAVAVDGEYASLPGGTPAGEVCGRDAEAHDRVGDDRRADCGAMGEAICETEREVWDILNAGPRNCFTAEGLLVHNCLILDHADNHARLGFVTDISHPTLLSGGDKPKTRKEKGEPLPKECGSCHALKPPKVRECPHCGFVPERSSDIETEDGELIEITAQPRKITMQDKQAFWSMALWLDRERGKSGRLAKALYKSKFGVWPRSLSDHPAEPDMAFMAYEKSRRIAYAKRQGAGR